MTGARTIMAALAAWLFAGVVACDGKLQQGWTPEDRRAFYHLSQGSRIIPYAWFKALPGFETAESAALYRVIHDPVHADPKHPEHPVGFTTTVDPLTKTEYLGFTCAACHTGRMTYEGKGLIIDGAPAMWDSAEFLDDMVRQLVAVSGVEPGPECHAAPVSPRFTQFAGKVGAADKTALRKELCEYLGRMIKPKQKLAARGKTLYPVKWGYGRNDALNRGSNFVLTLLHEDNVEPADAPVSIPQIWQAWRYDWVHWNGSVQNPTARNLSQALTMRAFWVFEPMPQAGITETECFSTKLDDFYNIEPLVQKLEPPPWPGEALFGGKGRIDPDAKQLGEALYGERCQGCHGPHPLKQKNEFGQDIKMKLINQADIGTDGTHMRRFQDRKARVRDLSATCLKGTNIPGPVPATDVLQLVTTRIMEKELSRPNPPDIRSSPNEFRAPDQYVARPNRSIWATAPYLHNGSVPTLYHLLSPVEKRPARFCVGNLEFEPREVGFRYEEAHCADRFVYDTGLPGNSNAGHEFRNDDRRGHVFAQQECADLLKKGTNGILGCELDDRQRWAIIEFLKTL